MVETDRWLAFSKKHVFVAVGVVLFVTLSLGLFYFAYDSKGTNSHVEVGKRDEISRVSLECDYGVVDEPKSMCRMKLKDAEGELVYDGWAGVEYRGRTSLSLPKKSYAVELRAWHEEWHPTVLHRASEWKYVYDFEGVERGWMRENYDDTAWERGIAPFGYGEGYTSNPDLWGVTTSLWSVQGRHPTAYYRHTFVVPPTAAESSVVVVGMERDDGAIVYLDGLPIFVTNLAEDATYDTLADVAVEGTAEGVTVWSVPASVSLPPGRHVLAVEVHQASVESTDTLMDLTLRVGSASGGEQNTVLVPWGSVWKYEYNGVDLGTSWRDAEFRDDVWESGVAPLGFGRAEVVTDLRNVSAKPTTAYFRTRVEIPQVERPGSIQSFAMGVMRDDGVVVYVNGQEVFRDNMDPTALSFTHEDWAVKPIGGQTLDKKGLLARLPPSVFRPGENTVAVEIHQATPDSADLYFELYVEALGADVEANLFGFGRHEDWILDGAYVDRALLRNPLGYDLFGAMWKAPLPDGKVLTRASRWTADTAYCHVDFNGAYEGLYVLTERIDRSPARLNLRREGSFIVKLDDIGFHRNCVGSGWWKHVYPVDVEDLSYVNVALTKWEASHHLPDPSNPVNGVFSHVDIDSAVDFVIIQELFKNVDAYASSVYLWRNGFNGKFHFLPWDLDLTFGYPYWDCDEKGWISREYSRLIRYPYIHTMATSKVFQEKLSNRYFSLREDLLSLPSLLDRIAYYESIKISAIDENLARWPVQDITFTMDPTQWANLLCPINSYTEEISRIENFISKRLAWMDENIETFYAFDEAPELDPFPCDYNQVPETDPSQL